MAVVLEMVGKVDAAWPTPDGAPWQLVDAAALGTLVPGLSFSVALHVGPASARTLEADTVLGGLRLRHTCSWPFVFEALQFNTGLCVLDLHDCSLGAGEAGLLSGALQDNATLRELDLSGNALGDDGAHHVALALDVNRALAVLDLSHTGMDEEGVISIAKALDGNATTALTRLALGLNDGGHNGLMAVAAMLANNSTLEVLDLSDTACGDAAAVAIARALDQNATLRELDLSRNGVCLCGLDALGDVLRSHVAMQSLRLSGNCFGVEDPMLSTSEGPQNVDADADANADEVLRREKKLTRFFKALGHNRSLECLCLSECALGEAAVPALAASLAANTWLRELQLQGNSLGDSGARAIAAALSARSGLTLLDMERNGVSLIAAFSVQEALATNPFLCFSAHPSAYDPDFDIAAFDLKALALPPSLMLLGDCDSDVDADSLDSMHTSVDRPPAV